MSPRTKNTDDAEVTATVPNDPHVIESLVESEKEVAPLTADELRAIVLELCDAFASVDTHEEHDGRVIAERLPLARARVVEIRALLDVHRPRHPPG